MRRIGISLALIGIVACGLVLPTWGGQVTQQEMNRVASAEYKRADTKLNAAYKRLIAKLPKSRQAKLKKSQLAWLKFRDAETKFLASEMEGGSAEPELFSSAMARLTEKRTSELEASYRILMSR